MSSGIHISTNKNLFGKNDELIIHVWFSQDLTPFTTLLIKSPSGEILDSTYLKAQRDSTETFAFTCSEVMKENGKYSVIVESLGGR